MPLDERREATDGLEHLAGELIVLDLEREALLESHDDLDDSERVQLGDCPEQRHLGRERARAVLDPEDFDENGLYTVQCLGLVCISASRFSTPTLHEHLDGHRVPEERGGARGQAVRAGLEDDNQVADFRLGKRDVEGEQVERRA